MSERPLMPPLTEEEKEYYRMPHDKPTYNHAYSFGFEVPGSTCEQATDVTGARLRERLLERLARLTDDELLEACDCPFDTYQED